MRKLGKYFLIILGLFLSLVFLYFLSISYQDKPKDKYEILTNKNGEPIFSTGNCSSNLDCFPSGCSSQICANHEVVTTCELVEIPEKETYTCGCINQRCVWFRKL